MVLIKKPVSLLERIIHPDNNLVVANGIERPAWSCNKNLNES